MARCDARSLHRAPSAVETVRRVTLVLGGARSGKSAYAEALAKNGLKSRMDEAYRAEFASLQSGTALAAAGSDE